jgi:hypothetical protein
VASQVAPQIRDYPKHGVTRASPTSAQSRLAPHPNIFPLGSLAVRSQRIMKHDLIANTSWSTASFGDAADTSPMELSALGEHLDTCQGSRGRLFAWHCVAETMHGFIAARLVTTLMAVALLIGVTTFLI